MSDFIQNRRGENIAINLHEGKKRKVVFIHHGLGGFKEQPIIKILAQTYKKRGYTVVTFDATNSFGQSDGSLEKMTVTKHIADLEDVITWAKTQKWYVEPFALAGYSMGALACGTYASRNALKVHLLNLISPVVSGKSWFDFYEESKPGFLAKFKKDGVMPQVKYGDPSTTANISYHALDDSLNYDLLRIAPELSIPTYLMYGAKDQVVPPKAMKELGEVLPAPSHTDVLGNGGHDYTKNSVHELAENLDNWLKANDKRIVLSPRFFVKIMLGSFLALIVLVLAYMFGVVALVGGIFAGAWALVLGALGAILSWILGLLGFTAASAAVSAVFGGMFASIMAWFTSLMGWAMAGPVWALILSIQSIIAPILSPLAPLLMLGRVGMLLKKPFKFIKTRLRVK